MTSQRVRPERECPTWIAEARIGGGRDGLEAAVCSGPGGRGWRSPSRREGRSAWMGLLWPAIDDAAETVRL